MELGPWVLDATDRRCNISRGPVQAGLQGKMGVKEAEVLVELEGEAGSSCLELERDLGVTLG